MPDPKRPTNGADTLVRASCNPFFDYMKQRIEEAP